MSPVGLRPSIAGAYRAGELGSFFRLYPGQFQQAFFPRRPGLDRVALADALRAYHRDLGTLDTPVEEQLARLSHPESRVVVTGQQAGLLGGPAYSVHKGASAALLARQLDSEERPVVPVYWVASQDHDVDEVASTTLLDRSETLHRLKLDLPRGRPVGRVPWQPGWTRQVLEMVGRFDAPAGHKAALLARLEFALAGQSYADVFARLLHRLLGPQGVIVLDPLHPALARLMVPALRRELEGPLESSRRIEAAASLLEGQGFEPQLRRPAGATNLFLEDEAGERQLLRQEGRDFVAGGRRYRLEELERLLDDFPDRLTPAAGLRPIIQDSLLPTVAFVVGPGEIGYGAQLREVYALHGLEQPLLWPRLSVTWLESNVSRLLARLGVSAARLMTDPERVLGEALAAQRGAASVSGTQLDTLRLEFERLSDELAGLDPTLASAARRVRERSLGGLERLQGLAARALARAEDDRSRQLTRLRLHLLPNGVPQEREMNFLTYLLKHGDEPLRQLMEQQPGGSVELELR